MVRWRLIGDRLKVVGENGMPASFPQQAKSVLFKVTNQISALYGQKSDLDWDLFEDGLSDGQGLLLLAICGNHFA